MIGFQSDYLEGAHPAIIARLAQTNLEQTPGYGTDQYCESARARIREACQAPDADVHFLVGGTQANTTVIASILNPYQGVISADAGHIACHETGAVEGTGHKVITLPSTDGLITGSQVRECIRAHFADANHEHIVQPGMVYISFPTESGTLYSKRELADISAACHEAGIPLFVDGARLGYGLVSPACDITLPELAKLVDVFYIGGTKCGALFGEAVVITNDALKPCFRYMIKRQGGMLAKGRLLGIQFDVLMENGLYFDICHKAIDQAFQIRHAFEAKGVEMFGSSQTNQQFPILTKEQLAVFDGKYRYEVWGSFDETHTIVRFCTSWATPQENVDALLADIAKL